MKTLALYIHIPYCLEKCPYCDFHSVAVSKPEIPIVEYAHSLGGQLEEEVERLNLSSKELISIFFGGGTPSLMPPSFFEEVLERVKKYFGNLKNVEVTVEVNPKTANRFYFEEWLKLGINRVSFGAQSFQEPLLKKLGRSHQAADGLRGVEEAKLAGFKNISADLIFGIEGETLQDLEKDLDVFLSLKLPHVSVYQLTVEPFTPLASWVKEGRCQLPENDLLTTMYKSVFQKLQSVGLMRYEISNYAWSGFESRHNLQYWNYEDYLGIGSGAVSFINNKRWRTTRKLRRYLLGKWEQEDLEEISPKTRLKEKWMMGLRLSKGVSIGPFEEQFFPQFLEWQKDGFLKLEKGRVFLTEEGFLVSNQMIQKVFDFVDRMC